MGLFGRKSPPRRDLTRVVELVVRERDRVAIQSYEEIVRMYSMEQRSHLGGLVQELRASDGPEASYLIEDGEDGVYDVSVELWLNDDGTESVCVEIRETGEHFDQARAWFAIDEAGAVSAKGHRLLGERGDFSRIPDSE